MAYKSSIPSSQIETALLGLIGGGIYLKIKLLIE